MRKKEKRLIITFHTTADAIRMERECEKRGIHGRLIPVPRTISSGCGMCWCTNPSEQENLLSILQTLGLQEEALHLCMI